MLPLFAVLFDADIRIGGKTEVGNATDDGELPGAVRADVVRVLKCYFGLASRAVQRDINRSGHNCLQRLSDTLSFHRRPRPENRLQATGSN